jgi:hypothetical protein
MMARANKFSPLTPKPLGFQRTWRVGDFSD